MRGKDFRQLREAKGLNVFELGLRSDVAVSDINYIENENREMQMMPLYKLNRLLKALDAKLEIVKIEPELLPPLPENETHKKAEA